MGGAAVSDQPRQWQEGWVCPECKETRGADLHDPCLGRLPGVRYACCGHGGKAPGYADGYVCFENGVVIRFARLTRIER